MNNTIDPEKIWPSVLLGIIFPLGFLGNLVVIAVILCKLQLKSVSNIFILNLAIADFLYLIWIPVVIMTLVMKRWPIGSALCKLHFFCFGVNQFGSVIFLTFMCVDRYLAVCLPLRSRPWRTTKRAFIGVAVSWILMICLMLPVLIYGETRMHPVRRTVQCQLNFPQVVTLTNVTHNNVTNVVTEMESPFQEAFTGYSFAISYFAPLILTWTLYTLILRKLYRQRALVQSKQRKKSTRKITKTVLSILILYTICLTPSWMYQMLLTFNFIPDSVFTDHRLAIIRLNVVFFTLKYLNSASNPILYTFLNVPYREAVIEMIRVCIGRPAPVSTPKRYEQTGVDGDVEPPSPALNHHNNLEVNEATALVETVVHDNGEIITLTDIEEHGDLTSTDV